jgi:hypothetical protein
MCILLSSLFAAAFVAASLLLPFRFSKLVVERLLRLQEKLASRVRQAVFHDPAATPARLKLQTRFLGATAAGLFIILALSSGAPFRNEPEAVVKLVGIAAGTLLLAILLLAVAASFASFVPAFCERLLLRRFGFSGLWAVGTSRQLSAPLREGLAARLRSSSSLGILDVTGFELLGKGPGAAGGLLYDAIESLPELPVQLLLLEPASTTPDPDKVLATVSQSLLAEMEVSPETYARRIQSTVNAVERLNEKRPEAGLIEMAFYTEKPAFRLLILDDTIFVSPFHPRETAVSLPVLEISRRAAAPTFYEPFRRHFALSRSLSVAAPGPPAAAAGEESPSRQRAASFSQAAP